MALRDQPYLPLYIQDFMTDEKLNECSAKTCGVYIRIMCLMHKSEEYGKILLKQKDKQTGNQIKNFAIKCDRHLPYGVDEIEQSITELISEGVLYIEGDYLCQKRMIKDNIISELRSKAGTKGATKKTDFAKAKHLANTKAKVQANSEYEYENEIENEIEVKDVSFGKSENLLLKIKDFAVEIENSYSKIEAAARRNKTSPDMIKSMIPDFVDVCITKSKDEDTWYNYCNYFSNWLANEFSKQKKSTQTKSPHQLREMNYNEKP